MNEQEVKKLYQALLSKGYSTQDLGDEQRFLHKMSDAGNRKQLYDWVASKGNFRIGDFNAYESRLTGATEPKEQPTVQAKDGYIFSEAGLDSLDRGYQPTAVPATTKPAADATGTVAKGAGENASEMHGGGARPMPTLAEMMDERAARLGTDTNIPTMTGRKVQAGMPWQNVEYTPEEQAKIKAGREANAQKPQDEEPSLLQTVGKSIGAGFVRVGAGLIDALQALSSNVDAPLTPVGAGAPSGYYHTPNYDEQLKDKNNPLTKASDALNETAERMSREAQPYGGQKGFLDLLWDGELGKAAQKGVATAGESLPMTLSWANPYTATLNAISMAGGNYREETLANPEVPEWKRASYAIGSAAIEQAVEKYADPVFKYVGGTKILKGAAKETSKEITQEVTKQATESIAKRIFRGLGGLAKDAAGEGVEEVITNFGNDALGVALDALDGNKDYGLTAQWERIKEANPNASLQDFALAKAKENVEAFIGGALAGAYTSGTAQVSIKALEYATRKAVAAGEQIDPATMDVSQSFDEGYNLEDGQEMNDAKNGYDLQRQRVQERYGDSFLNDVDGDPVGAMLSLQGVGLTDDDRQMALDYVNAKAAYDGMIQRVRDDIDGRIAMSDAMIDGRRHKDDGMIHPAIMKNGNRQVYIVGGNIVMSDDGLMVDGEKSDESVVVRDAETGKLEFAAPGDVLSVDDAIDADEEMQTAQATIRQEYAQAAADKIDGVLPFAQGDTYQVVDDQGQQHTVTIVAAAVPQPTGQADGNGDVTVSIDGGEPVAYSREAIQQMFDNANLARLQQFEQEKEARRAADAASEREANRPVYNLNDEVTLQTEEGTVRGSITAEANEDGLIEVYTEVPIGGKKINLFSRDELDGMVVEHNGAVAEPQPVQNEGGDAGGEAGLEQTGANEPIPEQGSPTRSLSAATPSTPAADATGTVVEPMPMIGEGEDAEPDFLRATPVRAHTYIYNEAGLSREEADQFVEANKKAADKDLKKAQEKQPQIGTSIAKYRKEQAEWQAKVDAAQQKADYWQAVKDEQQKVLDAEAHASGLDLFDAAERNSAEMQRAMDELAGDREAMAILADREPHTLEEIAASMLAGGVKVLSKDEEVDGTLRKGLLSHTGYSRTDVQRMPFIFASSEKGGLSVDAFGEEVLQRARDLGVRYDTDDAMAGVNALLGVMGEVGSQGDINNYIQNRRIAEARAYHEEMLRQEDETIAEWAEAYHLSVDEVEAFMEYLSLPPTFSFTEDEIQEIYSIFAEKILTEEDNGEQNQGSSGLDQRPDETGVPGEGEGSQGEVLGEGLAGLGGQDDVGRGGSTGAAGGEGSPNVSGDALAGGEQGRVSNIQGLENYSEEEISDIVTRHFNELVGDEGVSIVGIKVIGSRANGNAGEDSDLDVLLEYSGDMREDTLFDILNDEENRLYIEGIPVDINPITKYKSGTIAQFMERNKDYDKAKDKAPKQQPIGKTSTAEEIAAEEAKVDTNPTEAQKEAGNYKKGHIRIDGFDITIENPKGSVRSGFNKATNTTWETVMHNTYGYIRGTEGVDGDHIDVFLSDNPESGNVYVIDQMRASGDPLGTVAEFDEHKVMYGFNSAEEARQAYLSNYEEGWQGLGAITEVSKDEFKKWVNSSHRKTKPFAEYKSVKPIGAQNEGTNPSPYSIEPTTYTNKKGKETPMFLVKFGSGLTKEQIRAGKEFARESKGWWDREQGGFMMRSEDAANELAEALSNAEAVADAQPMSLQDMAAATEQHPSEQGTNDVTTEPQQTEQAEQPVSDSVSDSVSETKPAEPKRLVSDERMEELKARLRKKMGGQMNMGVDPEILAIGAELAVGHIERGLTKFADYAKTMIEDLGDAIRPYLKAFYNAVRDMPEAEEYAEQMDSYEDVRKFDLLSVRPEGETSDTTAGILERAEEVAKEQEAEEQAEVAKGKLTEQRNDGRKVQSEGVALDGTPLRAITEKDLDNRDAKFYHQGKRVYIFAVMRSGEQVSATQFSEPHLDNIYLTNGQSIKPEELMVADETKEPVGNDDVQKILDIAKKGKKTSKSKKKSVSLQQEPDLFGSFGEDATHVESLNDNSNGHARTDAVRSEGLPADGNQQGEHTERRSQASGQEGERAERGREVRGNGSLQQGLHDGLQPSDQLNNTPTEKRRTRQPLERPNNPKNTHNNHAERGKDYAPRGVDARIDANIKAIELMKQLMDSGEQATPEQMAVLRQFSGWGGLGKAFNPDGYQGGYRPDGTPARLRALLGEEAYQQANMSRNSAYYTPANVIDALWDIAQAMGFKGGRVLEGSAGIGNILGLMPTDMSERSDIHAVEIDQTTGNILSLLYPDAKVDVQGFEATQVENGSVDLAITNVPFVTGLRVNDTTGDKDLSKKFHDIHDFCIAKNIRKLKEGGIGIFITSSGTLDNSARLREWIVQEGGADVVGAFRLNNETFGGTGATSDIIVIRKRVNGKKSPHAIDVLATTGVRTAEYDTGETKKVKGEEIPIIKQLSMDYNSYFARHPEMMGGEMHFNFEMGETRYPTSRSLFPVKGKNQADMLKGWAESFSDKDWEAIPAADATGTVADAVYEELGEGVKEGSMVVSNGQLCIAQRGKAVPLAVNANKVKGHSKVECFEAYQGIKKALSDLLQYQTENEDDAGLQPLLKALNKAYDDFVKTYGHLHKNTSISFLKSDVDFANILALEKFSERGDVKTGKRIQEFGKTDIFSRRVVEKEKMPEPKNVKDGIIASIYVHGRVDVPWIVEQLNQHGGETAMHTEEEVKAEIVKSGLGFENPVTRQMEVSYEYLSGNVREKLAQAQANNTDGRYDANIKALEKVVPMDIPAHLIDFSIGSSWIDPKLYEEYVKEKTDIDVTFTSAGGTWFMRTPYSVGEQKNRAMGVVSELLHKTIMGTQLIEAAMQNKTITVSETHKKWDGSTETITDKEATQACSNKIDEIRQDFKEWARAKMQSDPAMSERIERIYNDMFNNYVPKSIPMRFVPEYFGGATHSIKLRPHQAQAVIRGTTQPLLLAHEVGSGKTYTLISTAMEMRRLGTARKPMIVVQNATVGQFVEDAKELYPGAKVLTIEEADRTAEGRRNFYAKIKYNDWDMIVVPQSVFERIPDSEERQMKFVQDKIEEKMLVLEQMRDADPDSNSWIVKQAEKEIDKLEDELAGLTDSISSKRKERDEKKEAVTRQNAEVKALEMLDRQTDDVENFDDMGIDAILVDEAHEYKHLGFATAMQRGVKGVDPSYSKKAQGVYLKTQAVLEKNNGRNVVFATGTPISNTAAEIWTFMRYLMPADTMKEYGIYYFDDFVRNFGNLQQMLEFTTSGKFKEVNRFAGYVNLPELVRIWAGVADTVLNEDVEKQRIAEGGESKIPEMEGGKATDIYLPQTRALRSVMKYVKKQLDDFDKMSGKDKKANSHIPLTMYGIAKAAAVDARLVVSDAADEPQSKTNEAVRQTLRSLRETESYSGTVALFADNYQNKRSGFNLYEDIREKLIAQGVPAEQIVVMKSGMSVKKKLEIFDKVNRGEIRVIMGSTFTLGTGVNIQERLHTLIHLDAPNRPMDYTQRNGRILRQGNLHKEMGKPVRVLRFGVEDSLDVTAYQRLKTKGAIADSIMNGKQMMSNSMENRALEEEEDVFGDTVAQLSGSEYAMLKNQAEKDVRKYEAKKKQYQADQTYCHNEIPRLEGEIRAWKERLDKYRKNLEMVEALPQHTEPSITVGKQTFPSIEAMADFIKEYNKSIKEAENDLRDNPSLHSQTRRLTVNVGGIDFVFTTEQNVETKEDQGTLFSAVRRKMTYSCEALGLTDVPVHQSLLREGLEDIVKNVISGQDFREGIERSERIIDKNEKSLAQVRERHGKPFEFEKELEQAHERFDEYSELMKKELEEKEKKYAEMDADVEEASDISEAEEADDETEDEEELRFRDDEEDIEAVNEQFNERLDELDKDRNQKDRVLHLGHPGTFLLNGGIADGEIVMDFDRFVRKSSENYGNSHPFTAEDIKDLPKAINAPIAVFDSASNNDKVILTELKKDGKNFIVAIRTTSRPRKGGVTLEINEITTLYPKNAKGIVKWIIDGRHTQIDKEKALRWIEALRPHVGTPISEEHNSESSPLRDQQRTNLADVDSKELDSAAKVVQNFENPKLSEENLREREGDSSSKRLTDEESLASSRRAGYTKKQHDAWQERAWRHMHEAAESTVERLGLGGRVTILESADGLKGRKAKAKGWFDAKTGKIVVVLGNHHSVSDVVKTILHEGVAHYGLRKLFGQHFDQFLDNVYQYADESVRREIVELAKKHGWDFRVATEEYLARLAEDTHFEEVKLQGWWSKIKSLFIDMLHSIGLGSYGGAILTNNELRYILWRSYENMVEPGRYRNPFREAEDISMQMRLGVGSFDRERARIHSLGRIDNSPAVAAEAATMSQRTGQGVLFRDGDFSERDRATARNAYEEMVSSGLYQFQEAVQDSMLGLKKLYDAILSPKGKVHMEDVEGYENAYLAENRMSSVNAAEQHDYYLQFMLPLLEEIGRLTKPAANATGTVATARQMLTDYMMAKHGLERNRVFAERDANAVIAAKVANLERRLQYEMLTDDERQKLEDEVQELKTKGLSDAIAKFREKDYAGVTALTGEEDLSSAEAAAQQMVDEYEAAYDTADLWDRTREATQATLEKIYRSGLLSKERYEQIRDMFEYYIPLQGWDETTSDEVYGYLTSKSGPFGGSPIKHAVGRSSKADDPIATIAMMADAAIRQGNRNLMKQRFLNFVLNHPSDLVSVHDLWLEYDAATDEWIPVFADLEDGDTAADVERKVEAFEQRMEQLAEAEPDRYKRGREAQGIPYKVVKGNLKEHQVLVKRGGRTYVLTINGNPRAAQALNGLTNPDVEQGGVVGNMLKAGEWVNRHLSAFYTTRNPDFVVSNFFRDMLYSNCMTWVKESPRYALRYHKNFGMVANPVMMRRLLGKWEKGTLDRNKRLEEMFYQFMMNGGETGYTSVRDIEEHKREIAKELKKQGSMSRKAWSALGMQLDLLNRSVENSARFAAFVTSREMGRSIDRSIYDAKEVSVNFNKKGSGGKMVNATGQTLLGKVGSYVGGGGRLAYVFWNAGVQGLTNFGRAGKRHGGKAFAGAATMFILGYVIPQLAAAMGGGDGDDDDKNAYYNLPEYVRRSNICFRVGDKWVTIPLPIEFRSIYGLGELASGAISGNEHYDNKELSYQIASQVSQILPLDMLEGGGGVSPLIPSAIKPYTEAYIMNKSWTGLPIYKDTPWNQNDPEWTKAYKNADQSLVGASKWLNEKTGGDDFKKGAIDINPAKLEYLLSGVFGGYVTTAEKLKKMGETALGNREFDWRNMLIANRVVKTGDERTANRKLQNEYFKYKKEYEETKRLMRKYEDAADEGVAGMAEKVDFLYNSKEYLRYELFDEYKSDIDDYREDINEAATEEERKDAEAKMYATMRELIDQLHEVE